MRISVSVLVVILLIGCAKKRFQEKPGQEDYSQQSSIQNPFKKTVGAPIEKSLGARWVANYSARMRGLFESYYTISNESLQEIINKPECVGIALYYATDNDGHNHILPIGIDSNGNKIATTGVSSLLGNISIATAIQWINNANPREIMAHFFGSNTFIRLNSTPCDTVQIDYAIDDEGTPQLLLRNQDSAFFREYEDRSSPCPPYCSGLDD